MNSEHHKRVGQIFIGALAVPECERKAWLEENTDSRELRAEVERLLSADQGTVPFLDSVREEVAPELSSKFESYELGEVIGEGGMGVVHRARQLQPNRQVAIKLLSSIYVGESLDRFKREIEILGRLEHEAVARVYDAGISERRPYIVMELVEGIPLTQYTRRESVSPVEKLRLFVDVCEGVAHAHARGVIHRDLKPSNILVTEDGHPKILDFGIARSIVDDLADPTLQTQAGVIMGTLQYMSPEQARGESASADVRSDVYALGGILFEMVEGRRPVEIKGDPLAEAVKKICETPPPTLTSPTTPGRRDLDVIISKAMAKEPDRRYETVAALAADVTRVLKNEPILARAPSAAYVFTRFARRHRAVVASVASALALVVVVTTVAFLFILDSRNEERRAKDEALGLAEQNRVLAVEEQAARKRAVADAENARLTMQFVLELFEDLDPLSLTGRGFSSEVVSGDELTATDILDRGAARLKTTLQSQPATRAYLLDAIGRVYVSIGFADRGEPLLREAHDIRQELQPEDPAALAASLFNLGLLSAAKGERCADQLKAVLELQKKIHGEGSEEVMTTLGHLAVHLTLERRFNEAAKVFPEALDLACALRGEDSRQATLVRLFWAELHLSRKRPLEGLELARRAAASIDRHAGNTDFSKLLGDYIGARFAMKLGQEEQAEALFISSVQMCERLLGERHFLLASVLVDYGDYLARMKKDAPEALPILERGIRIARMRYGNDSHLLAGPLTTLARVCRTLDRNDETMRHAREIIRIAQSNDRVPRTSEAVAWHLLAVEHYNVGRWDEAERALRRVIALRRTTPKSSRLRLAMRNLGKTLLSREGHTVLATKSTTGKPKTAQAWLQRAMSAAMAHELSLGETDEEAAWISERFASMVMSDLEKALEEGLSAALIQESSEFDALRGRSDFPASLR